MANNLPSQFDHYQILQLLGGGSFGDVYLAKDTHLRRQVVLKVLRTHLAQQPDMVMRFMREAQAMAKLHHANIVMVHSVQQTPPYIVMEYVPGSSLAEYLNQKGALYFGEAAHRGELLSILRQMAAGLDAAHRQQIVHRSLCLPMS